MSNPARTRPLILPRVLPEDGRRILTADLCASRASAMGRISAFELACACVSDNDNVPSLKREIRTLLGIALVGPALACLGMVVLMLGMAPA